MADSTELDSVLNTMFDRFREQDIAENSKEIALLNAEFPEPVSPYLFHRYIKFRAYGEDPVPESAIRVLARVMAYRYAPHIHEHTEESFLITDLYARYKDYDRHFSGLMSSIEGTACSRDKALGVMDLVTRRLSGRPHPEPRWNLPDPRTWDQWVSLARGFADFPTGNVNSYIEALAELTVSYNEINAEHNNDKGT